MKNDVVTSDWGPFAATLNSKYAALLGDRHFNVEANKDQLGVYAKVTLRTDSGSFYYPVEGRMADIDHDMKPDEAIVFLIEYIDGYFEEYMRENDIYLPIDWTEYEHDGLPFQIRGQIVNRELELLADQILAKH